MLGEVGVVEQGVLGGSSAAAEPLLVDLAVAGHPHRQQLPLAAGLADLEHHVLQGVGGGDGAPQTRVGPLDQRGDGRGAGGVVHLGLGQTVDRQRLRDRGDHRLDVGGVTGFQAAHEGVLADLAFGEEFLGCAAAHRAGDRRDDDVAHRQPVEDPLVGLAVRVVDGLEPVVVDVEGVGVLHHELAAAQDAGPRPGLVAVLGLDLVQQQREVLVGAVLPLDRQREQLFVGGPEQIVVAAAVLEPEHAVAVLGPPVRRLVGRAAAAPGTGSPARQWHSSRRGRPARSCAAPAGPAAASCTARARPGGCSRPGSAACGWGPRRRPGRRAACAGTARTCG